MACGSWLISDCLPRGVRRATLRAPARSLAPGRLRVLDRGRPGAGRQDLEEVVLLPLEHERGRGQVLADRVEPDRALDAAQRDPAVQVGDDLGVGQAAGRV